MNIVNTRKIATAGLVLGLLTIPWIATLYTDAVEWDIYDFLLMGGVLTAVAFTLERVTRKPNSRLYRWAFATGLFGLFLLFWVNGAVGIIGDEGHPANLLFGVVFLCVAVGALVSGLRAKGMSITFFAASALQMLTPLAALWLWPRPDNSWSPSIGGVFLLSAFFALLFVLSGFLFQKAYRHARAR